jgi:radical SAM superfamily enzyme YgiQ (UPF0313 family)
MQEIRLIRKICRAVYFIDDNFVVDTKHVMGLCDAIIQERLGMLFMSTTRADVVLKHPELFEKMAAAGFILVFMGLENFSNKSLQKLKKQFSFEEIKSAIKILHDLGFIIQGNVILGSDFSVTEQDLERTIEIAKSLDIDIPTFSLLTPLPGTELMKEVQEKRLLISKDWRKFDWVTPTMRYPNLTSDQLVKYHLKAYTEVPFFSNPVRRMWRIFRARHLSFFLARYLNFETMKGFILMIKFVMTKFFRK